jgi:hypothetical protein
MSTAVPTTADFENPSTRAAAVAAAQAIAKQTAADADPTTASIVQGLISEILTAAAPVVGAAASVELGAPLGALVTAGVAAAGAAAAPSTTTLTASQKALVAAAVPVIAAAVTNKKA